MAVPPLTRLALAVARLPFLQRTLGPHHAVIAPPVAMTPFSQVANNRHREHERLQRGVPAVRKAGVVRIAVGLANCFAALMREAFSIFNLHAAPAPSTAWQPT